jgi:predicted CXXCH cytochrome family protein
MNTTLAKRKYSEVLADILLKAGVLLVIATLPVMFAVKAVFAADAAVMRTGQDPLTVHGFVIRLASTSRRFATDDIEDLEISPGHRVYTTSFRKDGAQWQQLRLGFFDSKVEALAALKKIQENFPDAQVAPVTSADRRSLSTEIAAGRAAALAASVQEVGRTTAPAAQDASTLMNATRHKVSSLFDRVGKLSPSNWFGGKSGDGSAGNLPTQASSSNSVPATASAARAVSGFSGSRMSSSDSSVDDKDTGAGESAVAGSRPVFENMQPSHGPYAGAPVKEGSLFSGFRKLSPANWFSRKPRDDVPLVQSAQQGGMVKVAAVTPAAVVNDAVGFDHASTGFFLEGAHAIADCSSCHLQGVFKGTPTQCNTCHAPGSRMSGQSMPAGHIKATPICEECHSSQQWTPLVRMNHDVVNGSCSSCHNGKNAAGKSSGHISSGNDCETCHTTFSWTTSIFDHSGVAPGTCFTCHNGSRATGKKTNHVASANTCDDCHSTNAWTPALFDHGGVTGNCSSCHNGTTATGRNGTHIQTTSLCEDCHGTTSFSPVLRVDHADVLGTCSSCHNGVTAPGKSANHLATSNTCDDCHTSIAWIPAVFDHGGVTAPCSTCHNGTTATGKHPTHIQTSGQCDDCHTTIAWIPASFDHSLVTGSCSSCHNGSMATGKPSNHFVTSLQCDDCHGTSNWTPLIFSHSSGTYPGDHRGNPSCTACHSSNNQVIPWPSPAYQPDCAACHANDYKAGEHRNRSVSLDRDCGASGCHRVSSSSW